MAELIGTSKINGNLVHIIDENADFDVDIPTHKVEEGVNLSDHVEKEPVVVKLKGIIIRPTAQRLEGALQRLIRIETEGTLVTYEGRRIYKNMLLHGLSINANSKIMNGYNFSCTLTEVRIGQSSYVPPEVKAVTSSVSEAGRKETENKKQSPIYHTVKKGDTYWGLSKTYSTTVKQLQLWNSYDATKIPIGAKLRVG